MLTRAKNGERAIVTGNGWATGARLALVAWHRSVAEVDTTCALQQVPTNSSHIADLIRSALQYRLRQNRIILLHLRVIREIGIANGSSDLQSAIGHEFNLVEWQAINIEHACRSLHVELHQIDQGCPSAHKSHVRALLRSFRLCSDSDGRCGIFWPDEFEDMHRGPPLALRAFSNLLNGVDDICVGAAAADVATHQLLDGGGVGTARLFEQCDSRHDLSR